MGTSFTLSSSVVVEGGALPADFTCDGTSASPPLGWTNVPSGAKGFALLMTTMPSAGSIKYNWVLSGIPLETTGLARNSSGVGTSGVGSDGPTAGYQSPCSQGPGLKTYTFTLYALSASPVLLTAATGVTGEALSASISSISLASSVLNVTYTRGTTSTATSSQAVSCAYVTNSLIASTTGAASATCDSTYAYLSSNGLATHTMMDGIVATNLHVPVAQNFQGRNAWKIPLSPAIAAATTSAVDGPIGVAINGVPIFNPCKQGGCQNGDTKVLGELDVCNGHAGRADDYHYHAAPTCLMAGQSPSFWDTHPVGWALDGICGGNTSEVSNGPSGYSYHVTDASPYVLSCFRGTPSPDLASQASKFSPLRAPPVTPFAVSNLALSVDAADGYQVMQFNSGKSFTTTATGADSYVNGAGSYKIRFKAVTGAALTTLLSSNPGKTACWSFQFANGAGLAAQPNVSYCR
jgi:phosphatidylethanolamine-binding protein (PEBP) family uncharacterized protein